MGIGATRRMAKVGAMIGGGSGKGSKASRYVKANRSKYGLTQKGIGKKEASALYQSAVQSRNAHVGSRATAGALGLGALGSIGMSRRGPNQQQTMYRGPMQTGRGSGRYA